MPGVVTDIKGWGVAGVAGQGWVDHSLRQPLQIIIWEFIPASAKDNIHLKYKKFLCYEDLSPLLLSQKSFVVYNSF